MQCQFMLSFGLENDIFYFLRNRLLKFISDEKTKALQKFRYEIILTTLNSRPHSERSYNLSIYYIFYSCLDFKKRGFSKTLNDLIYNHKTLYNSKFNIY